jgi:hypothetical protein
MKIAAIITLFAFINSAHALAICKWQDSKKPELTHELTVSLDTNSAILKSKLTSTNGGQVSQESLYDIFYAGPGKYDLTKQKGKSPMDRLSLEKVTKYGGICRTRYCAGEQRIISYYMILDANENLIGKCSGN